MRLEHHLVGGYVRYISPHIIIIINLCLKENNYKLVHVHVYPIFMFFVNST